MILSIKLTNWRSHNDSLLDFRQGTNLLIGEMGSGKSSVLDAISFALFGTFPSLERRRLKLEDVIRTGQNNAEVQLQFQWNGSKYKIKRKLERKRSISSDAMVFKEEQLLDSGPASVNRYIEQLLHVDYDLFTRAIYSEQNNIDYFLSLDPRNRKQEIDALLGLDKFEVARANSVSVANRIRTQRKTLEEKFDQTKYAESQEKEKQLIEQSQNAKKEQESLEHAITTQQKNKEHSEKEFVHLKAKKEEFERSKQELAKLEGRIEQIKPEAQQADEVALKQQQQELQQIEQRRKQLSLERRQLEEKLQLTNQQKVQSDVQIAEIERKLKERKLHIDHWEKLSSGRSIELIRQEVAVLEQELIEIQAREKSLLQEASTIDEALSKLTPTLAHCPICEQPLSESALEHVRKEKSKKIKENKEEVERIKHKHLQLRTSTLESKKKMQQSELLWQRLQEEDGSKELPRLHDKRVKTEQEAIALKEQLKAGEQLYEHSNKQWEQCQIALKEQEAKVRKKLELERLMQDWKKHSEKLLTIKIDDSSYDAARAAYEEARIVYEKLIIEKKSADQQYRSVQEMLKLVSEDLKRWQELKADSEWLAKLEEELMLYKNALSETQAMLRSGLVEAINAALNDIWRIFYPYRNYSQIRLRADEKDYVLEVFEGQWKSLESIASGGERSCAALALRVALATVLTPNLSWLILDEPTHNLDRQAVELLSQTLQFRVPEVVQQTFVITHEESLMGSDFASSYKFSRDKANSGSTRLEKI